MQGPVLQPFVYDEAHPYAAGQHRGIDIAADAAGEQVVAPAAGTVSFAGSVPSSGESLTIQTSDGYSVTLTHLGSIAVSRGASVAEGAPVATIGPSGTPEVDGPYVHLGIRVTSDPNGYLDPLRFLPPPSATAPAKSEPPVSQPSTTAGAVATPTTSAQPAPTSSAPPEAASMTSAQPVTTRNANVRTTRSSSRSRPERGQAEPSRSSGAQARKVTRPGSPRRLAPSGKRAQPRPATPQRRIDALRSSSRRPVVEASPVAHLRLRLDAGHELAAPRRRPQPEHSSGPLPLACNGGAALVALAAAFAAGRSARRRRRAGCGPHAQILHLPRAVGDGVRERRAA